MTAFARPVQHAMAMLVVSRVDVVAARDEPADDLQIAWAVSAS